MTTLAQAELSSQPEILKCIAQELGLHFGIYARVVKNGKVKLKDKVSI